MALSTYWEQIWYFKKYTKLGSPIFVWQNITQSNQPTLYQEALKIPKNNHHRCFLALLCVIIVNRCCTVKPVCSDHPWDQKKVAVICRWSLTQVWLYLLTSTQSYFVFFWCDKTWFKSIITHKSKQALNMKEFSKPKNNHDRCILRCFAYI